MNAAALSDAGRVRKRNEDAVALLPSEGLFIVADGIGGHQAGATASQIVTEALPTMIHTRVAQIRANDTESWSLAVRDVIVELSQQIRRQSASEAGFAGMGATVVLAHIRADRALIAHMGDSRAYLYRHYDLRQLTDDHSVVGVLLRKGQITPEEADDHPAQGRLSRYVGMDGEVYADVQVLSVSCGDRLLLCTDGLTGMVADAAIATTLGECDDPEATCRALVDAANEAGGRDNITVLVVDFLEDELNI
jgi:serine/threonine protein phosphatase PrpC